MSTPVKSNWRFQFRKPSYTAMKQIAGFLKEIQVREYNGRKRKISVRDSGTNPNQDDALPLEGTFDETFSLLTESLEENYAENFAERQFEPWDFDYVVTDDSPREGAVCIWTRLYNPRDLQMGSSLYGIHIMRIDFDRYLTWIDY